MNINKNKQTNSSMATLLKQNRFFTEQISETSTGNEWHELSSQPLGLVTRGRTA